MITYCLFPDDAYYDKGAEYDVNVAAYRQSNKTVGFFWYHLLGLVWMVEYILACQQLVVAAAVAAWFFTRYITK